MTVLTDVGSTVISFDEVHEVMCGLNLNVINQFNFHIQMNGFYTERKKKRIF